MEWFRNLERKRKVALLLALFALVAVVFVIVSSGKEEVYVQPPEVVKPNAEPDENLARPKQDGGRIGGILVTPSTQEVLNASVGTRIDPVLIQNNSNVRVRIDVNYVPMRGNSLVGAPEYDVTPETIRQGKKEMRPDIRSFILLPGAEKRVGATIVGEPKDDLGGIYGLLVFQTDSLRPNEVSEPIKGGVRLRVNKTYSIGAIVLARFDVPERESFRLEQIRLRQADDGGQQIQARVRNRGNTIASPDDGRVLISRNSDGNVVEDVALADRQGIFPGDKRDLIGGGGNLRLPEGEYTATARVAGQETSWAFRINEQGELPVSEGLFEMIPDPGRPLPEEGFDVNVQMRNTGLIDLQASGKIELYRYGVDEVLATRNVSLGPVDLDGLASETVSFPGLSEEGNYELVLELEARDGISLGQKTANLVVDDREAPSVGIYDRLRDWMSANPLLTLLLGAAFFALIGGALLLFVTREDKK